MSDALPRKPVFPWPTLTVALFAVGIAGYGIAAYLTGHPLDNGLVQGKVQLERFVPTPLWTAALVVHVAGGSLALLAGAVQWLGVRWGRGQPWFRAFHVIAGLSYAGGITVGAAAGLIIAPAATGGWVSALGFGALDLLWFTATVRAAALGWKLRRRSAGTDAAELRLRHRAWMTRSYALTAAAITLRIWLPLAMIAGFDFLVAYRAIAWLCWVPNLAIAELLIRRRPKAGR